MQQPSYLTSGDKVAIVSPSGMVDQQYIDGAVDMLTSWQLTPIVSPFAREISGRFAGTDEQRLHDLQQALDDSSVRAILCSRGGYGMVRIIDKLNFEAFVKHPKWLIGFSDITVLHAAAIRQGVQSIHAVMAKGLTESNSQAEPVTFLREILFGKIPATYTLSPNTLNRLGKATGTLAGGNLSVLHGLRGTTFDIQPEGKILFIEDLSEKPYHIDRMMQNLRLGGILSQLSGLLVGRFTEINEDPLFGKTVEEIIRSAVDEYDYPVAFDFPVGHIEHNLPVIHGGKVRMTVSGIGAEVQYA